MAEEESKTVEKEEAVEAHYVPLDEIEVGSEFKAPEKQKPKIKMSNIHYKRPEKLVKKVKQNLKAYSLKEVGEKTFDYYVDLEEIENE